MMYLFCSSPIDLENSACLVPTHIDTISVLKLISLGLKWDRALMVRDSFCRAPRSSLSPGQTLLAKFNTATLNLRSAKRNT